MAANADVVLRKYHPGEDKSATMFQLERAFVLKGYGLARARVWIKWFYDYGIIRPCGQNEKGEQIFTCLWW